MAGLGTEPKGLSAKANSKSTAGLKKSVLRLYDIFRSSDDALTRAYPAAWDDLLEASVCCPALYEQFAHFLTSVYVITSGEFKGESLRIGSVLDYWRGLLELAFVKYRKIGSAASKEFFLYKSDTNSSEAAWLGGMLKSIRRECFQTLVKSGRPMDNSEVPIYLEHIQLCSEAWAQEGSPKSAFESFATLSAWLIAGRASEVAWVNLDGADWDLRHCRQPPTWRLQLSRW